MGGRTPDLADPESLRVLIRLLRSHLGPYKKPIALLVLLQLLQTSATLYLPTLNANIIDNGVVNGDTGYILGHGGIMIAISLVQVFCNIGAVFYGARTAAALGRDVRAAVFARVQSFSAREVGQFGAPSLITRTTNDVQQVQMLVLMAFTLMVSAPIMCVGGIIMALGQDVPLSGGAARRRSRPRHRGLADRAQDAAAVPHHADPPRHREPGAARADHRQPRDPRLRARRVRAGPLQGRQHRAHRRLARHRPPDGADVPDRHDRRERLVGRRGLVRRAPHRQRRHADRPAHRVPRVPHADRDGRHDGHLHVHDGAARRGLRRAHRGGPRHRHQRGAAQEPGARTAPARPSGSARRRLQVPRRRGVRAARRRTGGPARRDHRRHRLDRQRQVARCSASCRG